MTGLLSVVSLPLRHSREKIPCQVWPFLSEEKCVNLGLERSRIPELFEKNPYMHQIYPTDESMKALTAFQIYEGTGEWFDLSKKPIERASFTFGGAEKKTEGYYITGACIGCGSCTEDCPQNCIVADSIPHVIRQEHCLYCGNCASVCPVSAVERR